MRAHLEYPDYSMYEAVRQCARNFPDWTAYEFMGRKADYRTLISDIDRTAACLAKLGVSKGDRVLICMPNAPQAVEALYACSRCGAVAAIVHPLSSKREIEFYVRNSRCKVAIVLDAFAGNFADAFEGTELETLVCTGVGDALGPAKRLGYALTLGRKVPPLPDVPLIGWKEFKSLSPDGRMPVPEVRGADPAIILYSGGTTGKPKGVLISNLNINSAAYQTLEASECMQYEQVTVLSVMPMFHGFGLCVGVHMFLVFGGRCILVPRFTPESYADLIVKERPNFIAGVPTLFKHMIRVKSLRDADLSFVKGIYVGGDSLTADLRDTLDAFLKEHNCGTILREGFGMTECVTASCLTPLREYRRGSIGIPFPDTYYKIVAVGTEREVPYGEEGEICISGPSVMMGYVDEPEETAAALRVHADGRTWMHTGDLGAMDEDGFVYFHQRFKRMIVSSGYNIYPTQIENIIDSHPAVSSSCAIGVPDEIRQAKLKVFIVLNKGYERTDEVLRSIRDYCREYISKFSMPREFEFIDEMPRTKVGKVAYRALEELEAKRRRAPGSGHSGREGGVRCRGAPHPGPRGRCS